MHDPTGRCSRCGQPAIRMWTSRDASTPVELCGLHVEEHKNAVARWTEVEYT